LSLLLVTVALLGGGRQRQRRRLHRLLHRYTTAAPQVEATAPAAVTRSLLQVADRVAARRGVQDKLALALDRAAVTMTPGEWLLMQAGLLCAGVLVVVATGGNLLAALLVGGLLGCIAPGRVLASRGRRRQKRFEVALPDMLQMTAGSLSAGYSLAQALDGVVREGSEPMATELGRALAESRLGIPVETTLEAVATRMASRDFAWVVMAIRVQREVGGNLAGILTTVSTTMRERAMLRRHVRGLSAEGRLSAYILIGLPCFLALYMLTLRRSFIQPLYTTGIGIAMITVALLLLAIGSLLMSRMVKVEV
jgi:tight adherence protein B